MSMVWLLRIITNPYYKSVQLRYQLRESYRHSSARYSYIFTVIGWCITTFKQNFLPFFGLYSYTITVWLTPKCAA